MKQIKNNLRDLFIYGGLTGVSIMIYLFGSISHIQAYPQAAHEELPKTLWFIAGILIGTILLLGGNFILHRKKKKKENKGETN